MDAGQNSPQYKVLLAEDDASILELLAKLFEHEFALTMVEDGQAAIEQINQTEFHLVIADIHLPEKTGLDICAHVKGMPVDIQPSVMILSGDMSDETVREAYALGACDYIGKPINLVAFQQRVMRLSRDIIQINALREEDSGKRSLAETVMKQASAYGSGLELLARLNQCQEPNAFMDKLASGLLAKGYHCAMEFRHKDTAYTFDVDTRICSENELKVFELLRDKGRIYQFGKRTIFNEPGASLLVKNMPTQGTISYDSAIDLLAKLIPALSSRFQSIMHLNTLNETKTALHEMVEMVTAAMSHLEKGRRQKLDDISVMISGSFQDLDLTEIQENFFLDIVQNKLKDDDFTTQFGEIVTLLKACEDKILTEDEPPPQIETEDGGEDIELF